MHEEVSYYANNEDTYMIKYYQKRYTLCSYLRRRSMAQKYKRVFLIVLDSVGMGNAADAADYGCDAACSVSAFPVESADERPEECGL